MFWPLSWDDDNWRSMFHTLGMNNHALTVVMSRWQLTEHVSYLRDILPCSDCFHETMTTDGAWFIPYGYITMLWLLSRDDDNWRSTIHTKGIYYHALTVVMWRWLLTKHVSYMNDILPCSDRCDRTMTTVGACFILEGYVIMLWPLSWDDQSREMYHYLWNMLRQLSSSYDNGQSMLICHSSMKHAPSVVFALWQRKEHGNISLWY